MNYLQYTSKEMLTATQLVRQSKKIFDSLKKGELDKAVILRDGKPSFILMDFEKYEALLNEYLLLKENTKEQTQNHKKTEEKIEESIDEDKGLKDFWE